MPHHPKLPLLLALLIVAQPAIGQDRKQVSQVASLTELQESDQRVADIGWRLATRNLELCPKHYGAVGLSLHTASQYDARWRSAAITAFSLDQTSPGALAVAEGSPAWLAGIRPNDVIMSINGTSLAGQSISESMRPSLKASYARTDFAMSLIEGAKPGVPLAIEFKRANRDFKVELLPVAACSARFEIAPSSKMNANSNGQVVQIFGRLVLILPSDDDLALVMAHELAHNALNHNQLIKQNRLATGWSAIWTGSGKTLREFERNADRYGIFMAARAGFQYQHAPAFWSRLSTKSGIGSWLAITHPNPKNRAIHAREAVEEVQALEASGLPLIPAEKSI